MLGIVYCIDIDSFKLSSFHGFLQISHRPNSWHFWPAINRDFHSGSRSEHEHEHEHENGEVHIYKRTKIPINQIRSLIQRQQNGKYFFAN